MKKSDQKPPILLVHGFRGNHLGLAEFQKLLEAEGYQVFNPDIPPAFNTQDETLPKMAMLILSLIIFSTNISITQF